jgi:hypothetical protein
MPPEDTNTPTVEELQQKLADAIAESKKYRQRAQSAEQEREGFKSKLDELEGKLSAIETEAQQKGLEAKGQYDQEQHAKALKAAQDRTAALESALGMELGTNQLQQALGQAGLKPELIGQAAKLLRDRYKVSLGQDGKCQVEVFTDDGSPLAADDGNPGTLQTLAARFAAGNPHFLPPSGDTGSGAKKGGGGATVSLAELDKDPRKKAAFIAEHGQDKYLALALKTPADKE